MTPLNILIVGSGGREHALAWACAQSVHVEKLFVAPGNGGTAAVAENVPISAENIAELRTFAHANEIGLTIVGPEVPLAAGIVDQFEAEGLSIFGPSQAAAQLEASKAFAKQFMVDHDIPTAAFAKFDEYEAAVDYLHSLPDGPIVLKASGLAAGKGVLVCDSRASATAGLQQLMQDRAFGDAGDVVLIEECLVGAEVSLLALCDGHIAVPLLPARDHKRAFDGDVGPNTGGMGVYAPPPDIDEAWIQSITESVLQPTVDGMRQAGTPFRGVLYAGLMLTADGPKVLEFNCRFGDPETQVILPLLRTDLVELLLASVQGELADLPIKFRNQACASVVLASGGYPGSYEKGKPIHGLDAEFASRTVVFHAGTRLEEGQLLTNGGRVMNVTARGDSLADAVEQAYAAVEQICFEGMQFRTDIGRNST